MTGLELGMSDTGNDCTASMPQPWSSLVERNEQLDCPNSQTCVEIISCMYYIIFWGLT